MLPSRWVWLENFSGNFMVCNNLHIYLCNILSSAGKVTGDRLAAARHAQPSEDTDWTLGEEQAETSGGIPQGRFRGTEFERT